LWSSTLKRITENGGDYRLANTSVRSVDLKELQASPKHLTHPSGKENGL
jgi:hypothetical protein